MKKILAIIFLLASLFIGLVGCVTTQKDSNLDSKPDKIEETDGNNENLPPVEEEQQEVINHLNIVEDGIYNQEDEVALYISLFFKLPSNYMTKSLASPHIREHWTSTNKASVGGDYFGNREGLLPKKDGRTFIELDINYQGGSRNAQRIVYSSDFRIFYTHDHYRSFVEYDKEMGTWKSY